MQIKCKLKMTRYEWGDILEIQNRQRIEAYVNGEPEHYSGNSAHLS
jgi:hypothetical protein